MNKKEWILLFFLEYSRGRYLSRWKCEVMYAHLASRSDGIASKEITLPIFRACVAYSLCSSFSLSLTFFRINVYIHGRWKVASTLENNVYTRIGRILQGCLRLHKFTRRYFLHKSLCLRRILTEFKRIRICAPVRKIQFSKELY